MLLTYRESTSTKVWKSILFTHYNPHTMELFLLFSLALTGIAFLSIVLAEPPSPLSLGTDTTVSLGMMAPMVSNLPETGAGMIQPGDFTLEIVATEATLKEYPVAV